MPFHTTKGNDNEIVGFRRAGKTRAGTFLISQGAKNNKT
jgi:hypothetical protein